MVLLLDGSSEHGPPIWNKSGISICRRHLITSKDLSNPKSFSEKNLFHFIYHGINFMLSVREPIFLFSIWNLVLSLNHVISFSVIFYIFFFLPFLSVFIILYQFIHYLCFSICLSDLVPLSLSLYIFITIPIYPSIYFLSIYLFISLTWSW